MQNEKAEKEVKIEKVRKYFSKEVIILLVYFAVLFIVIAPTKIVTYTVEAIYQDIEAYTDVEPYEVEEKYTTKEAYISSETYQDSIPISRDVPYKEEQIYYEKVEEVDCDAPSDCFCQDYALVEGIVKCVTCACQRTKSITKYRTEVEYEKVTKTRPVTKYRDVVKTRMVTKYRDINKTRTIANVRSEERVKNVNWLFGFTVPWKLG